MLELSREILMSQDPEQEARIMPELDKRFETWWNEEGYFRVAALLRQPAPAPGPTIDDIWGMCEDHEFHLGMDGANEEESAESLLEIINTALGRWGRPASVQGWQPIDTAPHDGSEILASDYDAIEIVSWDAWETGSGWTDRNGQPLFPAWWQPLPDHPPIPQPPQANTTHPTPRRTLTDEEIMDAMPRQLHEDLAEVCRLASDSIGVKVGGMLRACLNRGIVDHCRTAIDRAANTPSPSHETR